VSIRFTDKPAAPIVQEGACAVTPPSEPLGPALWQAFAEGSYHDGLPTDVPTDATSPPQWSRAFASKLGNQQNASLATDISNSYGRSS
jgi:hypothetical protein